MLSLGKVRGLSIKQHRQPLLQTLLGLSDKKFIDGHAFRDWVIRQEVLTQTQIQGAASGDLYGILQCLWNISKQLSHLICTAQILTLGKASLTTGIIQCTPLMNTDSRLVGFKFIGLYKAHIIGGDHRTAELRGQSHGSMEIILLTGTASAL